MAKGDAEKVRNAKIQAFTEKYKEGDVVFSPLYQRCRILKMNKKTISCVQVDEKGKELMHRGREQTPMLVDKHLFNV